MVASFMNEKPLIYEFQGFRLDVKQQTLARDGIEIPLTPKSYQTLCLLVQSAGRVLTKEEVMKALWPDSFVEEGNLSQNIFALRKVLGDDGNGNRLIETVPRRGYKFVAPVIQINAATPENGNGRESGSALSPLPVDYWYRHSPFRGLQVFEPEDSWLFFGRDSDISELLKRLSLAPVLVLVGDSGSGKSSLIRAGLIPALRTKQFRSQRELTDWRIALLRPSSAPFDYLAEALPGVLAPELSPKESADFIADCRSKFSSGGDAFRNAICALEDVIIRNNEHTRILLVVDQFEEIFTLCPSYEIRERYINSLLFASKLDSPVPVHLALVLRADFYANCLEHAELSRCLESNLYNLPRMTHGQLDETIEKRLALTGAHAEPGLVDCLLTDIGTEPGNLALLEHALDQLWEKCGGSGRTLTNQAYVEIGRLRGALSRHADEVYESIDDKEQKQLVKKIFLELIQLGEGGQDTRRRVKKADLFSLGAKDQVECVLGRLASSRLVSTVGEGLQIFAEVSHEALIREWSMLREWIAQNRDDIRLERRLVQAAEEWYALARDPGALLQGSRLSQAEAWFAGHKDVSPLLREFIEASIEARIKAIGREREVQQRELAQQRTAAARLRWFSCVLAMMLLIALAAAWFAHKQKVLAESRALVAQSEELLSRDHGRALDLAIKSWQLGGSEEAHLAVAKAFAEPLWILRHDGPVAFVRFSPDGKRILTASEDHTARIWSSDNGQLLATLQGHTDKIWNAAFSPDGQRVLTASFDHTARVWNAANGNLLAILHGHSDVVTRVGFSPDAKRIVTVSFDHTARIWNGEDWSLLHTLQGHTGKIVWVAFSQDGRYVATASFDRTTRIWQVADGHLVTILQGHSAPMICAVFSPDNKRIITGSWDGTARIWNAENGHLFAILQHNGGVEYAAFSSSGDRIITASKDQKAYVWNSADGRLLFKLAHDGQVHYAEFSPDGAKILTASADHTAKLWNSANGRLLDVLQHDGPVNYAAVSPDGRSIITASDDHTGRVWSVTAGWPVNILQGHTAYLMDSDFSPDGHRVVTASYDRTARVWSTADGRLLVTLKGHAGGVGRAVFSPDGERIITGSEDHTAKVWNSTDGRLLFTLEHADIVWGAAFSLDGKRIVTAGEDHTARIWNSADGCLLATLKGHEGTIWAAIFSPNGEYIVTAGADHTARVWDSKDGRLLAILLGHNDLISDAAFSPDGQRIVSASSDHTARIWSSDGRLLAILQGHKDKVWCARFSPDGQRVVTASLDHTARVWNSADGRLLFTLEGHTDSIADAEFSPDGKRIITGSRDNTARIWDSSDGALLTILRGHSNFVSQARFFPDGQRVLTISRDQTARIWQVLTPDDINKLLTR